MQSPANQPMHPINNFTVIESISGRFIVNRHCSYQIDHLAKTGRPHIQAELDGLLAIVHTLPDQSVTIDAGANIGLVCIPIALTVAPKSGVVHAVEDQRPLLYALCGTTVLNDLSNLHVHQLGLGAARSVLELPPIDYGRPQDFGSISLVGVPGSGKGDRVQIVTIDSLGMHRLDFLKIDVEGMEIEVLTGARLTIESFQPWVWVEYWKTHVDDIKHQFDGLNYRFFVLDQLNMLCAPAVRAAGVPIPANAVEV